MLKFVKWSVLTDLFQKAHRDRSRGSACDFWCWKFLEVQNGVVEDHYSKVGCEIDTDAFWPNLRGLAKHLENTYKQFVKLSFPQLITSKETQTKCSRSCISPARNETTYASMNALTKGMTLTVTRKTVPEYLALLKRIHICCRIPFWSPRLRSPTRIREAKKLHLAEPPLDVVALVADIDSLLQNFKTLVNCSNRSFCKIWKFIPNRMQEKSINITILLV